MYHTADSVRSMICCSNPTMTCRGDKCMGWVKEYKVSDVKLAEHAKATRPMPPPIPDIETGRGRCGLIR